MHFFVVDDDPDFAAIMTTVLEVQGHRVTMETKSPAALAGIEESLPDCVLVDIMMPEMDGLELCRRIRDIPALARTKVIMVSAKSYEFDRRRALEFGADGFVTKPVDWDAFSGVLEKVLADRIALTFWGVHGTLPVPGERTLRYGGNTSCVTLEFPKGQLFIFDAGSGIKELSNHLMANGGRKIEGKIFISHPHWDHINALPYFVPLYMAGNEFEILGPSHGDLTMRELLSAQMDGVYFPITLKEFSARVYFRDLGEETFETAGIRVKTMLLSHPGNCLGYRIEYGGRAICYVTDNELFLEGDASHNQLYVEKLTAFVGGADILITDTTYSDAEYEAKIGWGHSAVGQVADLAHRAGVQTLSLFHHDPDQGDDQIDAKLASAQARLEELGSRTKCIAAGEGDRILI